MGSLYLQKKTLTSFLSTVGLLWMMSSMFLSATYCTSGPDESRVTITTTMRPKVKATNVVTHLEEVPSFYKCNL